MRAGDREYVADFVAFGQVTGQRTPLASIRRLEPGEAIDWSPTALTRHRIWSLAHSNVEVPRDETEREARVLELIGDAVDAACAVGEPVWTELSGGLDSSTVTAMAASRGKPGLTAVSVIYRQRPQDDEERYMRAVVQRFGLSFAPIDGCAYLLPNRPPTLSASHRRSLTRRA